MGEDIEMLLKLAAAVLNMVICGEATVVGAHCTVLCILFCQREAVHGLVAGRLSEAEHRIPPCLTTPLTSIGALRGGLGNCILFVLEVLLGVNGVNGTGFP